MDGDKATWPPVHSGRDSNNISHTLSTYTLEENCTGHEAELANDFSEIRRMYSERTDMASASNHVSELARILLQHLALELPDASTLDNFETYKVEFKMNWDPQAFIKEQQYRERSDKAISDAITLTGRPDCAQATTTTEYLQQTWPISGSWILQVLKDMVLNGFGEFHAYRRQITAVIRDARTIVTALGSANFIAELGEQLAWLGSALRSSHFDNGLACCTPRVRNIQIDFPIRLSWDPERHVFRSFDIDFDMTRMARQELNEGTCWHDLFRNPVVVEGFPIRSRSEYGTGLDIPLQIMAGLIQARHATDFDGRLFIKGFSTLLFPTKLVGNMMIWHLIFNENEEYISYLDPRVKDLQSSAARKIRLVHLTAARVHVLGWCSLAKSYAGSSDATYPIHRSKCSETHSHLVFDRFTITAGQYINLGAGFVIGDKDKPLHLSSGSSCYYRRVLRLSKRFVLLYDVEDRRGWLVNGASALLHLVVACLKYEKSSPIGGKFLHGAEDLKKVEKQYSADSAVRTLINEVNKDLPILPGKKRMMKRSTSGRFHEPGEEHEIQMSNILFSDFVEQVMDYLEKAFIYEEEKKNMSGYELPLSFRQCLQGFDFAEIAESEYSVPRRTAKLKPAGKCWIDFIRKIKAVTLFGCGFGDIITPEDAPCGNWTRMPRGNDYLAVCVHDINIMFERLRVRGDGDIQIANGVFWHMPDKIFKNCACQDKTHAPCDRAQVLLPDKFKFHRITKRIVSPESLDGKEEGAVIFGESKKMPVHWPDDPQEIAQETM